MAKPKEHTLNPISPSVNVSDRPQLKQMDPAADDLLMRPARETKPLGLVGFVLTPMMTVSSPWNLGTNWSPRMISDWLRGRKRHSTFILHSAATSAMAQIQREDAATQRRCCWMRRRRRHRPEDDEGEKKKVKIERGELRLVCFCGWFSWGCGLLMRSVVLSQWRAAKRDVKPVNDPLHH